MKLGVIFLMAMDQEPEDVFLEALYHGHFGKSIFVPNASARCQTDQIHCKEPRRQLKLKAVVKGVLKNQQQNSFMAHVHQCWVKCRAVLSRHCEE